MKMVVIVFKGVIVSIVIFPHIKEIHPGTLMLVGIALESCISGGLVPVNILTAPDAMLA